MKAPFLFAVCGVKNSGKTTYIEKLIPALARRGLQTAVIKHDGHDFQADVPGTDTFRHLQAGACGTVVFSNSKYMLVKKKGLPGPEELIPLFPEADIVLLEGMKRSSYPKAEIVRRGISDRCSCCEEKLCAVISDFPTAADINMPKVPLLPLEDPEPLAEMICRMMQSLKKV